ncbi:MAG: hypothetical protein JWL95_3233 [Gemmatimonadetes bacterium]|nr:hypothetical protein [Gemmatimonadota bacterium]
MRGPTLPRGIRGHESPVAAPSALEQPAGAPADESRREVAQWVATSLPDQGIEVSVFSSSRQWRGCDVYLTATADLFTVLTVRVYAVTKGQRYLVASGRYATSSLELAGDERFNPSIPDAWVAAARSGAASFEVTISSTSFIFVPPTGGFTATIVCADDLTSAPPGVGLITSIPASILVMNSSFPMFAAPPVLELVAVRAAPGPLNSAPRYLHVHNAFTSEDTPNGQVPAMCWPLGGVSGLGVVESSIHVRMSRNLQAAISSTRLVTTVVDDGEFSLTLR